MKYAIIKMDDLTPNNLPGFRTVAEIGAEEGCPLCLGVIGQGFEAPEAEEFARQLIAFHDAGNELWNHGYYHVRPEFSTDPYEEQRRNFGATQAIVRERCGINMTTFGSPFNNSGETTVKMIAECFPEITALLFIKESGLPTCHPLPNRCNIESTTGVVSYERFCSDYAVMSDLDYFVLQGHPAHWTPEYLADFRRILGDLKRDGRKIVTAQEYVSVAFAK